MLRNFKEALKQHIPEIGYNKYWKWVVGGQTPAVIQWLENHEDLIDALKQDCQEMKRNNTMQPTKKEQHHEPHTT